MSHVTTWEYSIESELKRIIYTAHQVVIGFYKANNFIVLPSDINIKGLGFVIFPDLKYNNISRFWEIARKIDNKFPIKIEKRHLDNIQSIMSKNELDSNFEKIKNLWSKAEKEVIKEIYKVIPNLKRIKKLIIYPTKYGTSSSFEYINNKGEIIIYLREDQGIHTIVEAIITSLTREDIYNKLSGLWQESEIITDYLVTQTSIAKILQKYESVDSYTPTLKGTRAKQQAKLLQISDEFYKKLGIPSFVKPFSYNGLVPELFGKPINNLTETEKKILLNLIRNSNTVTEIDDIGSIMFKSEDNFSLYAISKTIQRLRDKLEANGISGSYIQTLRGKGYVLKN